MTSKLCKQTVDDVKLPNLGKEILEVKKRIQLSEGQRKALFEEIANESKRDADEILRLKKEIAKATLALHERRTSVLTGLLPVVPPPPSTVSSAPCRKIKSLSSVASVTVKSAPGSSTKESEYPQDVRFFRSLIGGSNGGKSLQQIAEQLDLQRIDKNKQLDLLKYKFKQKESKLKKLTEEYQNLVLKQELGDEMQETREKNAIVCKEYRNRINAVQVQIKEAEHVRIRYKDIRWKLQEDAAKFESKMLEIEEELKQQENETDKVKQVNKEALKLRAQARGALQREEKQVLAANATREKQSQEGKRLVEARTGDLSKLERHFNQPKAPLAPRDNNEESDALIEDEEVPVDPAEQLKQNIEVLKEATGSSCLEEVLQKVKGQTTTQVRLMTLRRTKEKAKLKSQRKYDLLVMELENLKFADDESNQQNMDEVEKINHKMADAEKETLDYNTKIDNISQIVMKIVDKLLNTYLCMFQDEGDVNLEQISPVELIRRIGEAIKTVQQERVSLRENGASVAELLEEMKEQDGDWLPVPYANIIRTPVPSNTPAPPQVAAAGGSEDEEELPTRGYLKRQAQLVVDAKNKRKTMRFPIPKTK